MGATLLQLRQTMKLAEYGAWPVKLVNQQATFCHSAHSYIYAHSGLS